MLRKATRTPRERTSARAAGAIAVTLALAAAAPGAQAQSDFVAIDFRTATSGGNAQAGRTAGSFTMSGRVPDAGRMTTAYPRRGTARRRHRDADRHARDPHHRASRSARPGPRRSSERRRTLARVRRHRPLPAPRRSGAVGGRDRVRRSAGGHDDAHDARSTPRSRLSRPSVRPSRPSLSRPPSLLTHPGPPVARFHRTTTKHALPPRPHHAPAVPLLVRSERPRTT